METRRYSIFIEEYLNNKLEIFFFKVNFEKEITNTTIEVNIQNIDFFFYHIELIFSYFFIIQNYLLP